jgi:hypothetical protein
MATYHTFVKPFLEDRARQALNMAAGDVQNCLFFPHFSDRPVTGSQYKFEDE